MQNFDFVHLLFKTNCIKVTGILTVKHYSNDVHILIVKPISQSQATLKNSGCLNICGKLHPNLVKGHSYRFCNVK